MDDYENSLFNSSSSGRLNSYDFLVRIGNFLRSRFEAARPMKEVKVSTHVDVRCSMEITQTY